MSGNIPAWVLNQTSSNSTEGLLYYIIEGISTLEHQEQLRRNGIAAPPCNITIAEMDGYTRRQGGAEHTMSCLETARLRYRLLRARGIDVDARLRQGSTSGSHHWGAVDPERLRSTGIISPTSEIMSTVTGLATTRNLVIAAGGLSVLFLLYAVTR